MDPRFDCAPARGPRAADRTSGRGAGSRALARAREGRRGQRAGRGVVRERLKRFLEVRARGDAPAPEQLAHHRRALFPPTLRLAFADQRARERIILRARAFSRAHRPPHPFHRAPRRLRPRTLGERAEDLVLRKARNRPALLRRAIPLASAHMNRHPRVSRPTRPRRHQHPYLRKARVHVDGKLSPTYVRGVVHLQRHIGQRVALDVDVRALRARPLRVHVQHLVGLHQPPGAPRHASRHTRSAEPKTLDARAAKRRESPGPSRASIGGSEASWSDGGRLAHPPGGAGAPVPELEPAFVAFELGSPRGETPQPGKSSGPYARGRKPPPAAGRRALAVSV